MGFPFDLGVLEVWSVSKKVNGAKADRDRSLFQEISYRLLTTNLIHPKKSSVISNDINYTLITKNMGV